MNRPGWLIAALTGIVGFLLGLVALRSTDPARTPIPAGPGSSASEPLVVQTAPGAVRSAAGGVDFAAVAARLNATVVNVDSAARGTGQRVVNQRWRRDLADDPSLPREGTGSGFIIDPAGYILTNFHVVDGADRLTISLTDGRAYRADVVGIDPALDVALLKIQSPEPLAAAVLGDSTTLRPGQWVCAIGNPLGYVHSVTVGVVSFLGRKLFDQALDEYIQTDAAISLGNSGGPLIDADGRVIGITTAVSSQAANIGFAIPINQVIGVLPQLRDRGRVSRGFAGMGLTRITPALERALALPTGRGALVQDVSVDSPAARAGLRAYDVVVAADGQAIGSDDELTRYIAARVPGTLSSLKVMRDGEVREISIKLTERPIPASAQGRAADADALPATNREQGPLGLTVRNLDETTALRRAMPDWVQGVVVIDVDPAGPARQARLRPGQVILEVNRRPTHSVSAFEGAVAAIGRGTVAAALVYDPIADQRVLLTIVPDRNE
jgi:serine protease Do